MDTLCPIVDRKACERHVNRPVTILNWSFVRDDQSREQSCYQLALAIRAEVLDLEQVGVRVIQIDEAAFARRLATATKPMATLFGLGSEFVLHSGQWRARPHPNPYPHVLLRIQ